MNWMTAVKKGVLGALTFGVSILTPQMVLGLVPDSWENLTIGAAISAGVVMLTNIVKNWGKK